MMRRRIAEMSITLYKPDYVIHVPHNIAGIWDYEKAEFLIEKGVELTDLVLPSSRPRRNHRQDVVSSTD